MTAPSRRDRTNEPTEQLRAQRQARERCIDCDRPSSTQRCPECRARVESATERYRGQGRPGRLARWQEDVGELVRAIEAVAKARSTIAEIGGRSDLTAREREVALIEPLSQVDLGRRHLIVVLERYGAVDADELDAAELAEADAEIDAAIDSERPRARWAVLYEARKMADPPLCVRCGKPPLAESLLCAECLVAKRLQTRRAMRRRRDRERAEARKNVSQQVSQRPRLARGTEDRGRVVRRPRRRGTS